MKKNSRGFTLMEIIVVASIIALLAAMSIVLILNNIIAADEASAQSALTTYRAAMEDFRNINATYPAQLSDLGQGDPAYIDSVLAGGTKRGYTFTLSNSSATSYTITASPQQMNVTGKRTFSVNESGTIT